VKIADTHWPEYLMEGAELGCFMISALFFGALLEHPASPVRQLVADPFTRRCVGGLAMGSTAIALIYSPWGRRSGAHFNPAVTMSFWRLGRVRGRDAAAYAAAQFVGAAAAVIVAALLAGPLVGDPAVRYAVTEPGPAGISAAFVAEATLAFVLMTVVLRTMRHPRLSPYTGLLAGALVATYIAVEAPLSGMSINPARTLASAIGARHWTAIWLYFVAPPLGMLLAAEIHHRVSGAGGAESGCAKLRHTPETRCIFCGHEPRRGDA